MPIIPAITGLGLVTPLGSTSDETWSSFLAGRFISTHARAALPGTKDHGRVNQLAVHAARQALAHTDPRDLKTTALVIGTSKGSVVDWITPLPHIAKSPYIAGGRGCAFGLASTASHVASELKLPPGPRLTLSAACASSLNALIRAVMMIQSGEVERALVVAVESSIHPLFIGCFQRLGVLPREEIGCRPFDETRDGFLISEAAAAVCVEAVDPEDSRPSPITLIDRFTLAGDATHLTNSDATGQTLRRMLRHVARDQPPDLIHAHATGTIANDPVELAAYEEECASSDHHPIVYSHKGALGHSLGAAGLVSVVLNCLSHRHGMVPGNVRTMHPLPTTYVRLSAKPLHQSIKRSIALAAGFGGAMAAISLKSR
jgi:3-oxoacyl-[acyl-carrier-protein] synthase II